MGDKKMLQEVQDVFIGKVMEKNSWGKNEIIELWKDSLLQILMSKLPDEKDK
jgi:hypothetical protein